ncbi:uncharacterized protein F4807DRAFT_25650 [Annulohypoxylon truncatum]|uniref:uncharacterized protein n=1 Tax=Annulohypoxylon truncatum TaxID=327061 RepID=UPI002007EDD1|nr:uncharacterized protein F4807DRAFT_25650 [Annulohypoxylon truncatum]KAI1211124.1 hypothetical protein F4807DRAFT_25650 [Annulohypoxylon truncatum]
MSSTQIDLCAVPAGPSPDGEYNFENPTNLTPVITSISTILLAISVILALLRMRTNREKLHPADWWTLVAVVINIVFTGVVLAQHKFNRHQWDIPVCWFTGTYFRIVYVQAMLFAPVFFTSKAAIFLLYQQIFGVQRRIRIAVKIGLLCSLVLYIPNIPLSAIFVAPPRGQPWVSMLTSDAPKKMVIWGIVQSSITILLDFYIFFLPLPVILKLNMPMGRRLQLFGVFTTALMGIAASALSLAYRITLLHTTDALWPQTIVTLCAVVEVNVAIIVSCMPASAHLWKLHISRSVLFQSLRSQLLNLAGSSGSRRSRDEPKDDRPKIATIGSAEAPRRRDYYELTDTAILKSQVTVEDNIPGTRNSPPSGIVRSVGFSQHFGSESNENLT